MKPVLHRIGGRFAADIRVSGVLSEDVMRTDEEGPIAPRVNCVFPRRFPGAATEAGAPRGGSGDSESDYRVLTYGDAAMSRLPESLTTICPSATTEFSGSCKMNVKVKAPCVLLITVLFSCNSPEGSMQTKMSNLTAGMVTLSVERGETEQADILETFGPPDQVTHRDSVQIWTYDKISYSTRADRGTLIFYEASSEESSSISTLLILYFDDDGIVQDYRFDSYRF